MKGTKFIFDILSWGLFFVIIIMALFTLGSNTTVLGGYRSFLVQSGSMEPTIMTGDIVLIHNSGRYVEKDVVTFREMESQRIVTHRLIKMSTDGDSTIFETKGDANRSSDQDTVSENEILGRVVFVLPKIGYLVGFAKSPLGFILFIVAPAVLLISNEIIGITKKRNGSE